KYPPCSEVISTDSHLKESCGFWPHLTKGSKSRFERSPGAIEQWQWGDRRPADSADDVTVLRGAVTARARRCLSAGSCLRGLLWRSGLDGRAADDALAFRRPPLRRILSRRFS